MTPDGLTIYFSTLILLTLAASIIGHRRGYMNPKKFYRCGVCQNPFRPWMTWEELEKHCQEKHGWNTWKETKL